ncbi:MAG: hypothetical protein CMI33_06715, partial [Opitutales bacterium]|nr:hypothetical protein [Opitutales bacterium]
TESQWEYACRAGTTTAYSWGNDINASLANYDQSGLSQTRDVGHYAANSWGFFDMHGNVYELTADHYGAFGSQSLVDPTGPTSGSGLVFRGGSWNNSNHFARSAKRQYQSSEYRTETMGFRVGFQQQ